MAEPYFDDYDEICPVCLEPWGKPSHFVEYTFDLDLTCTNRPGYATPVAPHATFIPGDTKEV